MWVFDYLKDPQFQSLSIKQKALKVTKFTKKLFYEAAVRRWITMPNELTRFHLLSRAIERLNKLCGETFKADDEQEPVFILSAGWRSGSILLQRLIISSGEIMIWGELLGDAGVIPKLADSLARLANNYPFPSYIATKRPIKELSNEWIANLTPQLYFLRNAHRMFFVNWLAKPAQEVYGVERWGLKEVRLTIDHARYLKWLFPKARFLFIYRNPIDAYRSWRGNLWQDEWPGYYTRSPIAFARHWALLVKGFKQHFRDLDGMLIKFEDLVSGNFPLETLAQYLKVKHINPLVLSKKISGPTTNHKEQKKRVPLVDQLIVKIICNKWWEWEAS